MPDSSAAQPCRVCVGPKHAVKDFAVFGAKAFAGIDNGKLNDTVVDRSIPIVMARKRKNQKREKFRAREAKVIADPIKVALAEWADDLTIQTLRDARPKIPDHLNDRAQDIVEPLLAIADMAGGNWPELACAALKELLAEDTEEGDSIILLAAIRDIFGEMGGDPKDKKITTHDLLEALIKRENEPWAIWWGTISRPATSRGYQRSSLGC